VIRYEGTLYRPPSEADSLILQATIGCSYNECTFCGMYRDKRFRVRPLAELQAEIAWAAQHAGPVRKVFLADGDALIAKTGFLAALLEALRASFPHLRRVSCYASPQALQVRSVADMARLRELGLELYYLGVESGDDAVLARLEKGVDAAEMVRVAGKAHDAGEQLSPLILLGAGKPVQDFTELTAAISEKVGGEKVAIEILRPADPTSESATPTRATITVTLGEW
jgi:radical SAM superfamily enzyme YgiQ (UPF0313 family)